MRGISLHDDDIGSEAAAIAAAADEFDLGNKSLPRPDWEPTMQLILPIGIMFIIFTTILTAYLEALIYLSSQQKTPKHMAKKQSSQDKRPVVVNSNTTTTTTSTTSDRSNRATATTTTRQQEKIRNSHNSDRDDSNQQHQTLKQQQQQQANGSGTRHHQHTPSQSSLSKILQANGGGGSGSQTPKSGRLSVANAAVRDGALLSALSLSSSANLPMNTSATTDDDTKSSISSDQFDEPISSRASLVNVTADKLTRSESLETRAAKRSIPKRKLLEDCIQKVTKRDKLLNGNEEPGQQHHQNQQQTSYETGRKSALAKSEPSIDPDSDLDLEMLSIDLDCEQTKSKQKKNRRRESNPGNSSSKSSSTFSSSKSSISSPSSSSSSTTSSISSASSTSSSSSSSMVKLNSSSASAALLKALTRPSAEGGGGSGGNGGGGGGGAGCPIGPYSNENQSISKPNSDSRLLSDATNNKMTTTSGSNSSGTSNKQDSQTGKDDTIAAELESDLVSPLFRNSYSGYGEYSLLGPGATFELPCLRVRSAQI